MTSTQLILAITGIVLIVAIAIVTWYYRKIILPMRGIANGMDLIRAQDFSSRLTKVGQPEADRIVDMFNTMMHNLKTERLRIREQNHFLDLLISVSPMGIVIIDSFGHITMHNPAAGEFLARRDLKGMRLEDIDSPLAAGIAALKQGETATMRLSDSKIYRCSRLSFMDNGYAHPFILIEQLTKEVIKAEKLAYEKVIRMISHEVNNSVAGITSILGTVSAIMKESDCKDVAETSEALDACSSRCMAMSKFISSYADVVKIPEAVCRPTDLNNRLTEWRGFLESMCSKSGVKLEMYTSDTQLMVDMDCVLFEQALINIIKNSIEAIGRQPDGKITIATDGSACKTMTVTDNGAGLSAESMSHMFTPFYSTKPDGQGLGLIFISDVLTKHGCRFNLHTSKDDGLTRFNITFP